MGKRFEKLSESDKEFIKNQKLFFVASSNTEDKEVNLSPRGYDCFRVLGDNEAIFLDYVGSGNRTARDIEKDGDVTILFTAFEGNPLNLRLFCKGEVVDKDNSKAREIFKGSDFCGLRQFIRLKIYCVENSCGMSTPMYEYKGERNQLKEIVCGWEKSGKLSKYVEEHHVPPNLDEFRILDKFLEGFEND